LISAAYTNYKINDENKIQKLQGKPLIITSQGRTMFMNYYIHEKTKYLLNNVLKNKPLQLESILNELEQSIKNNSNNLSIDFLKKCFNYNSIILWNGSSDKRILLRLGINCTMFNLTAYDEYNNKIFYLKFVNYSNNELIFKHKIGYVNKNGRLLSLLETHNLICRNNHNDICVHEPVSDVKLTKCIYDFVLSVDNSIFNKTLYNI